ncbi:hypothetical protein [Niastella vici]|nr:hypothetical protein [Niastella vici]
MPHNNVLPAKDILLRFFSMAPVTKENKDTKTKKHPARPSA